MDIMVTSRLEVLALIPARGGSKSIPRKNIKLLGGHPLIAYSIAAAKKARSVTRVIVSTDDLEIAEVAKYYDAEVPFMRPRELAEDHVNDLPVFEHALHCMEDGENYCPDLVVQLRPTSPIRPPGCTDDSLKLLLDHPMADSVRCVTPSGQNPYKMWRIENGIMKPLLEGKYREPYNMPRQMLPLTYWQTGHVEAIRRTTILHKHSLTGTHILPLIIESKYAIDLDTPEQWEMAEWTIAHRELVMVHP
jgi:CMP-N-acetylneuraminic acid synthetase